MDVVDVEGEVEVENIVEVEKEVDIYVGIDVGIDLSIKLVEAAAELDDGSVRDTKLLCIYV